MPTRTARSCTPHCVATDLAYVSMSSTIRSPASTARSGSSSWAAGAPNSASMPSPATWSTAPPKPSIARTMRCTAPSTTVLKSSGSRRSANPVEPTMSANSALTTLRASRAGGRVSRATPQAGQKRASCATGSPHEEQVSILSPTRAARGARLRRGRLPAPVARNESTARNWPHERPKSGGGGPLRRLR